MPSDNMSSYDDIMSKDVQQDEKKIVKAEEKLVSDENMSRADEKESKMEPRSSRMDPHWESIINKIDEVHAAPLASPIPAAMPTMNQAMPIPTAANKPAMQPVYSPTPAGLLGQPITPQMNGILNPLQLGTPPAPGQPPIVTKQPGSTAVAMPPETITAKVPTSMNTTDYTVGRLRDLEGRKTLNQEEANNLVGKDADIAKMQLDAAIEDKKQQAIQQAAAQKAMADAEQRDAQLRSMIQQTSSQQVDPNHYWNSKSTGGKIMAGIGILLGGIGMGIARQAGKNPAMDVMNKAIDDDMDAQKHNIENSWKGISATHGLDNDAFNRQEHDQAWKNNFRTAALENVKMQIAARASQSSSLSVQNNAKQAIMDLTQQQNQIKYQNYQLGQQALLNQYNERKKMVKELQESSDKDIQSLVEKGATFDEAYRQVMSRPRYQPLVQLGQAPEAGAPSTSPVLPKEPKGAETQADLGKRTVLINGQPKLAINEQAAKDYHDYNRVKTEADRLLNVLKSTASFNPESGSPGQYEAARAKLIEILPQVYGYNRGPSMAQVQETFGPESIPEYTHWYSPALQSRAKEKLEDLTRTLSTIDEAMNNSTFQTGTTDSSSLNQKYGAKPLTKSEEK